MTPRVFLVLFAFSLLAALGCSASASELKVVKSDSTYKVLLGSESDKKQKHAGKMLIEMQPSGEWKMNDKAPVVLDIAAPKELTLKATALRRKDLAVVKDKQYRFEVPYQAPEKSAHKLTLSLDFVVCTEMVCQKKRFDLTYTLSVD